jgi:hypothetical protein
MRPEDKLGFVLIVAPTAERDVLDGGRPTLRVRLDVVEVHEGPFRAPLPGRGHEGTLAPIPEVDRAFDVVRNVTRG